MLRYFTFQNKVIALFFAICVILTFMNRKNHLTLAHELWRPQFKEGASFIDTTAGNGHDALFIAQEALTLPNTHLTCIDIQEKALQATKKRLTEALPQSQLSKITYVHASHETLPKTPTPPSLILYNLGYLPGADKSLTTTASSTLNSLKQALRALAPGGLISLTFYPGHDEGKREYTLILPFLKKLSPQHFSLSAPFISEIEHAPKLYIIRKI